MLTNAEIRHGITGGLRTLWFDRRGPESFPADWKLAWRSFWVYGLLLPAGLAMTWYAHLPYYAQYDVDPSAFLAARLGGVLVALPAGIFAGWLLARSQNVERQFPAALAAGNWYGLVALVVFFPFWLLTESAWLPDHTRTTLGICLFVLGLLYSWFIAWRTLKVNPFMAVGFAVLGSAIETTVADIINSRIFGVARPFFDRVVAGQ